MERALPLGSDRVQRRAQADRFASKKPRRLLTAGRIPPALASLLHGGFAAEVRRARLHLGPFARILTAVAGANAIVFGRHVFFARAAGMSVLSGTPEAARLLAHELAHVRQYRRSGAAVFLGRYVGEYLRGRLRGARHSAAYRAISFEREAERASNDFGNGAPA